MVKCLKIFHSHSRVFESGLLPKELPWHVTLFLSHEQENVIVFYQILHFVSLVIGRRPADGSIFFKRIGKGVLSASAPEISAYIAPFGPMVLQLIPQPTGILWRLSGTNPSLGARRLNSLDPFLSHDQCSSTKEVAHWLERKQLKGKIVLIRSLIKCLCKTKINLTNINVISQYQNLYTDLVQSAEL